MAQITQKVRDRSHRDWDEGFRPITVSGKMAYV